MFGKCTPCSEFQRGPDKGRESWKKMGIGGEGEEGRGVKSEWGGGGGGEIKV